MKIEVDTDTMPGKSKDGKDGKDVKDGKPSKRSIEVSFFDIFTPGRTIRQAKNRAQALKATNNSNAQGTAAASGQDAVAPQAPGPAPTQTPAPAPSPVTTAQPQPTTPAPTTPTVEHPATTSNEDSNAAAPDQPSPADSPASTVETSPGWTADQDSRLTEMKNSNQSWKTISAAIDNKAIWELKKRWKEIGLGTDKGKNHNQGGKGKVEAENVGSKEKDAGFDPSSTHDQCSISSNQDQAGPRYQRIYIIDPDFTVEEIEFLQHLYNYYVNHPNRCLAVVSRFFDKSGRRITVGQVRDRFEDN